MAGHVIFDLDGTLIDSLPGIQWSVEAAMKTCGMSCACPDLTRLIGPPIREILGITAATNDSGELDLLERTFRTVYDNGGWRRTRCQPGVGPMLDQLCAAGITLSIVTNKPARATALILPELGIQSYFQEIVCRDSTTRTFGSKAEMLVDLLNRKPWPRAESILVGDTLEDCHAACAAGISCAVVLHGYGTGIEGVLPQGCRCVASWDELVERCTSTLFTKDRSRESALMGGEDHGDSL